MLQTTISYTSLTGVPVEQELAFNLNTIELSKLATKYDPVSGNLEAYMLSIKESNNYFKMITLMAEIVLEAYGKLSPDGKNFMKPPAEKNAFKDSVAYAEYVEELATNDEAAIEFGEKVLNVQLIKKLEAREEASKGNTNRETRRATSKETQERLEFEAYKKMKQAERAK